MTNSPFVPSDLYLTTLTERDRYRQAYNALRDELRSVKRELSAAREERDIAERRAARATMERDTVLEPDPHTLQWIARMAESP